MEKILFSGSLNQKEAKILAKISKIKLGKAKIKKFACGEIYVNLLDEVFGKKVFIYQNINFNPNEKILETLLIAEAARENGAKEIILILPLLPYSRQNKKTSKEKREPVSAKLLARLLKSVKVRKLITCHLHSKNIKNFYLKEKIKLVEIKTFPSFAKILKKFIKKADDWQIVAPDKGALPDAISLAKALGGVKFGYFEKKREDPAKEINKIASLKFSGKKIRENIILFDDMIDTGETILSAKKRLEKIGAKKIIVAATHPILSKNAWQKIKKANFEKILFSNSLPLKKKCDKLIIVDILPEIKKQLK